MPRCSDANPRAPDMCFDEVGQRSSKGGFGFGGLWGALQDQDFLAFHRCFRAIAVCFRFLGHMLCLPPFRRAFERTPRTGAEVRLHLEVSEMAVQSLEGDPCLTTLGSVSQDRGTPNLVVCFNAISRTNPKRVPPKRTKAAWGKT